MSKKNGTKHQSSTRVRKGAAAKRARQERAQARQS